MVKSVLGVNHQGLRDWLFQRVSAVVMVIYTIVFFVFFIKHPNLTFYEWRSLFAQFWMKIVTILVVLSLLFHAWVGMWTIFTDYIKCYIVRLILHVLVFFTLVASFFATIMILWGV